MRIFGLEIKRAPAASQVLSAVNSSGAGNGGWFSIIKEGFAGAWQMNVTIDNQRNLLAFSAVFACVTIIAGDIAKLGCDLKIEDKATGIKSCFRGISPYRAVLKKPNRYQTWYKFMEQWIISKLLNGNTYALKVRDQRGIVIALYLLDPTRVIPLVASNGDIYYQLSIDNLSGLEAPVTVPAKEIIHDTMVSLWHPLVGVSPIFACGMSATMGNKIQANSSVFFQNMSRPSGQLTSPDTITDETAKRLKQDFEENFSGGKIGRLMVTGNGLKYEPMTVSAQDAQLIEQLKWAVEDVARCFHVPMFKLGGEIPHGTTVDALQQTYYSDCLQTLIESAESLLDEGLAMPPEYSVQLNLDNLLRMDASTRYKANGQAVKDGWMKPDEARAKEDMLPTPGGDTVYLQQQNYSIAALAKRDAKADPFASAKPSTPALPGLGSGDGNPDNPDNPDNTQADDALPAEDDAAAKALLDYTVKEMTWPE